MGVLDDMLGNKAITNLGNNSGSALDSLMGIQPPQRPQQQRPSLEQIFSQPAETYQVPQYEVPIQQQRPSLEQIFSQPVESYQTPTPQQRPSLEQIFGTQQKPPQPDNQKQNGLMNVLGNVWDGVKEPASTALETLSYLDKPRGAIAGTVNAFQNDTPLWEGAKKGWDENTSWKETFNQDWVKENPKTAAVAGFAADVLADPLWLATPAKIAKGVSEGSKAIGLTDHVINPAVNALKGTERGQKVAAWAEDVAGKNRIADEAFDYNSARATDQLAADDLLDGVRGLKKQFGEDANKLTDYVEASAKDTTTPLTRNAETMEVLDMHLKGTLPKGIADGIISRKQAQEVLRDAGEEIPDYLLQNSQRVAKQSGKSIPDAITRDSVLNSIPNPGLRKAIETLGEQFITRNKANADRLRATGRLSDEAYVSYLDGEHLRRSFAQYETPEKFLEALRKNGSDEEYRRVYQALNKSKPSGSGFGANHKVDMKDFVQRQTLSDDTMKKLGLVKDPEYRIMDTLNRSSKTLREDEYLDRIATVWGKTGDEAADLSRTLPKRRQYVPIPDSSAYGSLAGKWVPKDIHDQVIKLTNTGATSSELVQGWQKAVSWFKVLKLVAFAPISRNFYAGIPMANVFGGLEMQVMPKYMAKAAQAISGGNNSSLMREIKGTGILGNVWNKQELKNIIGENPKGIKKLANVGMSAFGKPDEFWRIATYAYHRDKGKSVKEAAQIANKALFDYSNAPEWVNTISRNGVIPFAKFPFFSMQATAKAAYNKPAQLSKFIKPQNQVNNEDREKIMPDYMKSKTLLPLWDSTRTVNGKPQKVQNNLDLSYILPFASTATLGNPLTDAMTMATTGKNGLNQQIIKQGMTFGEKAKAWADWGYNSFGPSFPLPGNYAGDKLMNGWQGNVDNKGRQYDMTSAVLQTILGLKNNPINTQELYNQKVTSLTGEQRNVVSVMNQIAKDQSIPKKQKLERLAEHRSQLKEISKQLKDANEAWQREKKRGAK